MTATQKDPNASENDLHAGKNDATAPKQDCAVKKNHLTAQGHDTLVCTRPSTQ